MLAVNNLQNFNNPVTRLTLQNLKEYLQSIPHQESVELLCLDDCSSCDLIVDGKKDPDIDPIDELIDDSIQVYQYDFYLGLQEKPRKIYFNEDNIEQNVCFSLSVDRQGISEQVAVQFEDKVYDYSTYLTSTPVYNTIKEFVHAKETSGKVLIQ